MSDISAVAYEARNKAYQVERDQLNHEKLCAERYEGINTSLASLRSILLWGGGVFSTVVLGALGFMTVNLITTNDQRAIDQQVQIRMLQDRIASDHQR